MKNCSPPSKSEKMCSPLVRGWKILPPKNPRSPGRKFCSFPDTESLFHPFYIMNKTLYITSVLQPNDFWHTGLLDGFVLPARLGGSETRVYRIKQNAGCQCQYTWSLVEARYTFFQWTAKLSPHSHHAEQATENKHREWANSILDEVILSFSS